MARYKDTADLTTLQLRIQRTEAKVDITPNYIRIQQRGSSKGLVVTWKMFFEVFSKANIIAGRIYVNTDGDGAPPVLEANKDELQELVSKAVAAELDKITGGEG